MQIYVNYAMWPKYIFLNVAVCDIQRYQYSFLEHQYCISPILAFSGKPSMTRHQIKWQLRASQLYYLDEGNFQDFLLNTRGKNNEKNSGTTIDGREFE